jgi:hypothetical protein
MYPEEKNILEHYITQNEALSEHEYLGMNIQDAICGKEIYNNMKTDSMNTNHFIFGSTGYGQTSFTLYKSTVTNKIYNFVFKYDDIHSYELIENEDWFSKYTGN